MPDFKKMTVESLRELARKVLGPGHSKKSKSELVAALEGAEARQAAAARETGGRARTSGRPGPAAKPAKREDVVEKVTKAAKGAVRKAGEAARAGARVAARTGKAAAGAGKGAAAGAKEAKEASPTRERKPGKVAAAISAVAGVAAGAVAGVAAARKAVKGKPGAKAKSPARPAEGPDPDGFFVARVRGEDALREAPHPMAEAAGDGWAEVEEATGAKAYDEQLGELPWGYGDDAFVALPRDPRTLFLYWDWSQGTLSRGFDGLDRPRTQLWVFAREGGGWDRVRVLEFALESRGFYVHDLAPGRSYRAEIHIVDRAGRERLLATPSNECALPPSGPSSIVDDRFIRIPWDVPLGRLLGPGHVGAPFAEDTRALLARLSDWSRFSGPTWGGSAGGMGGRPFSPSAAPSSPSSPFGGGR